MAVKRKRWRGARHHTHGKGGDRHRHEAEQAARLAPLEETAGFKKSGQTSSNGNAPDTIRVDSTSVKMPEKFLDDERDAAATFRLDPAVLVILLAFLAFIAFIAWQITLMPEK